MFYCEWWSTTGSQRLLEEEASNGPGETPKCLDAGVPSFILLSLCLLLSLFYLFFLFSFLSGPSPIIVWPRHWGILDALKGRIWSLTGWAFSKVVDVENDVEQNPHHYFATAHFASLQQVKWRHGLANISRGNALAQFCFLPSNLYLVHHQTKVLLYLLKYLHLANALFYEILTGVSVGRISIQILMPRLWIVDIEDDWKGLRMHNFWSWQPACQLLYWIMDFLSFSASRVKKPPDKGEVSRPNEVRENPCRAEWKFQNRTNMHCNLQFSVLDILPSITGSWCSRGNKILFGIWELSATD